MKHALNTISAAECASLIKRQKTKLIDIRSPSEFNKEHIESAENIQKEQLSSLSFSEQECIIFYCQAGIRTSQIKNQLLQLKAKTIVILDGGLNAWKKAGYHTKLDKKAPIPIMHQVQIIVGIMVLIGVILGFWLSAYFTLISAFFGLGLLFAGLSGFCGLAKLLMLLPYNQR
ncbi:rhodanese family protein [Thiotrichales bacterium 19S3-7]|nr:rhodanese family protein [Thiotrichales bacterium 19S3-7]MCF6802209.1 rhodanese family protein [Thiotrichales bacterium 19S3-11]